MVCGRYYLRQQRIIGGAQKNATYMLTYIKTIKGIKPIKSIQKIAPIKSILSNSWSKTPLIILLRGEEN